MGEVRKIEANISKNVYDALDLYAKDLNVDKSEVVEKALKVYLRAAHANREIIRKLEDM